MTENLVSHTASIEFKAFTKTEDMRGLKIVPTRMVRVTIKRGDQEAFIDLMPNDLGRLCYQVDMLSEAIGIPVEMQKEKVISEIWQL